MTTTHPAAQWAEDPDVLRVVAYHAGALARRDRFAADRHDDLLQEGLIAAVEMMPRYDGSTHVVTYLAARVRGAMIDYLRNSAWFGRASYTGKAPRVNQFKQVASVFFARVDVLEMEPQTADPEHADAPEVEFAAFVRTLAPDVTVRDLADLTDYFVRGKTLRAIGATRGLSESAACQSLRRLLSRMNPATRDDPHESTDRARQHRKVRTADVNRPATHANLVAGSLVTIAAPDDHHVHGCEATVEKLEDWGARVAVHRAARPTDAPGHKPRWRALWSEMVPKAQVVDERIDDEACHCCGSNRFIQTGKCKTCADCGEPGGCS